MSLKQLGFGGKTNGSVTQTAGTTIEHLCQPNRGGITRVAKVRYIAAATAHVVTCLRPLATTTVASTAATGQAVVDFTADPGSIATGDWVAIRSAATGVTRAYKVSSVSTLAVTMTANVGEAYAAGDKIWFFGVAADVDATTGQAHPAITMPASTTSDITDDVAGVFCSEAVDQPLLMQSANGTNAGTMQLSTYAYTKV